MKKDSSDVPRPKRTRAADDLIQTPSGLKTPKDAVLTALQGLMQDAQKNAAYKAGPDYDAVFCTVARRLTRLTMQLVNYLSGTQFTGEEEIIFVTANMPWLNDQDEYHSLLIVVDAAGQEHPVHIGWNLLDDGKLPAQFVNYDIHLASCTEKECTDGWECRLPDSAAVLLRSTPKGSRPWKYRITSEEGNGEYLDHAVQTLSLPALSIEDLFTKELFILAPFYAFTYGADLDTLEQTADGQERLLLDAQTVRDRIIAEAGLTEEEKVQLLELTTQIIRDLMSDEALIEKMTQVLSPDDSGADA